MRAVGAGADKDAVDRQLFDGLAGSQRHVFERALQGAAFRVGVGWSGIGHRSVTGTTMPGLVPQVTKGRDLRAWMHQLAVETGAGIGGQRAPFGDGRPIRCLRG